MRYKHRLATNGNLLTAAPLVEAVTAYLVDLNSPPVGHYSQTIARIEASEKAMADLKQALADAATIAEHSAAIWRVVQEAINCVDRISNPANGSDCEETIKATFDLYAAVGPLPPTVRDIAGRGGR
jgi:hypothetical protein